MKSIKKCFKDKREEIKKLRDNGTEIHKVLRYIRKSGLQVRENQAEALEIELEFSLDRARFRNEAFDKAVELNLKLGPFSKAVNGPTSEQTQIENAWKELIDKSGVENEKKLIRDLHKHCNIRSPWVCSFVGLYLSKDFIALRHPFKVMEFFFKLKLFKNGKFDEKEKLIILQCLKIHKSDKKEKAKKRSVSKAAKILNRPRSIVNDYLDNLKRGHLKMTNKREKMQLEESVAIMKYIFKDKKPENYDDFQDFLLKADIKWTKFKSTRSPRTLRKHWNAFIKPTLLAYFLRALKTPWKEDFLRYVMSEKLVSVTEIDWNEVKRLWPYTTKEQVLLYLEGFVFRRQGPLHVRIEKRLPTASFEEKSTTTQKKLELIDAFEKM